MQWAFPPRTPGGGVCITRPSPASTFPVGDHCRSEPSVLLAGNARAAERPIRASETPGVNELHYSERPMCQQFRFASEGQSRSSRLLAERSPVCKHRLCRFGSNAVVISRSAGSDEREQAWHGPAAAGLRLLGFVQPGRDSRARSGACSVYESDSAGPLADRRESDDRQAPSGCTVGAGVYPHSCQSRTPRRSGQRLDGRRRAVSRDWRMGGAVEIVGCVLLSSRRVCGSGSAAIRGGVRPAVKNFVRSTPRRSGGRPARPVAASLSWAQPGPISGSKVATAGVRLRGFRRSFRAAARWRLGRRRRS